MDNAVRRRMALGFLSNWVSRLAGTIIQLVQVPVFLHFWSLPLYGEWIAVNAIPSYLSFSNIGFGSIASNEMTVVMGRGPRATAIVFAAANIAGTIVFGIMARRDVPWIKFGWGHAEWSEIKRLTPPAFAFMGFPIGQALNLQGTVIAVTYALGPV